MKGDLVDTKIHAGPEPGVTVLAAGPRKDGDVYPSESTLQRLRCERRVRGRFWMREPLCSGESFLSGRLGSPLLSDVESRSIAMADVIAHFGQPSAARRVVGMKLRSCWVC